MADLSLLVLVSRDNLGLFPLYLNDHTNYYIAGDQFLNGQVSWNRNQVGSPFVDGQITVSRTLSSVVRTLQVEVLGESIAQLDANLSAVVAAFSQDYFQIAMQADTDLELEYRCEASDYQLTWTGSRLMARQVSVQFSVPCQPVPITGGY